MQTETTHNRIRYNQWIKFILIGDLKELWDSVGIPFVLLIMMKFIILSEAIFTIVTVALNPCQYL